MKHNTRKAMEHALPRASYGMLHQWNGNPLYFVVRNYTMSTMIGDPVDLKIEGMIVERAEYMENTAVRMKRAIFAPPATIVYWSDDTKTVVKCQEGDTYDKKLGLALCFLKKFTGNKSRTLEEIVASVKQN